MKKSFSLIEIIVVIVIISMLMSFFISKYLTSINNTIKINIKAELALINNAITKKNSQNILLNESKITFLDKAPINQDLTRLFDNILDIPFISTNENEKKIGAWIKTSSNKYKNYFKKNTYIEYQFVDNGFKCISDLELCKEFE